VEGPSELAGSCADLLVSRGVREARPEGANLSVEDLLIVGEPTVVLKVVLIEDGN
jgi:hypothetical protein